MKEPDYDPETATTYECFECGEVFVTETAPQPCPECDGEVRNRSFPFE